MSEVSVPHRDSGPPLVGRKRVVLFDLDGTLVDTAPDLGFALNAMRRERGLKPLAYAELRAQASHGARGLIRLGFGLGPDDPGFETLRQEFLEIYAGVLTARSSLFPGMGEVLSALEAQGVPWGVVTNKPARFSEPLLRHLGLYERAACVVSGDTCAQPKPHPAPLLHACQHTGTEPGACLYVGDAARDVEAAQAAGMPAVVALWGYLGSGDRPETWGADALIASPGAIFDHL